MTRIVIIGGGPAGYEAALVAAQLGAEVTVVERDGIGGASVLTDCVPSKTLIAAAGAMTSVRDSAVLGLEGGELTTVGLDLAKVNRRVKGLAVAQSADIHARLEGEGVRLIAGSGRFVDEEAGRAAHRVQVVDRDGAVTEELEGDVVLVATGADPRVLPGAEPDGERVLDWRDVYDLDEPPEHLVVVGSGVTGAEFASGYLEGGVPVTLVSSRDRVLPGEDSDAAEVLEEVFQSRGGRLRARPGGRRAAHREGRRRRAHRRAHRRGLARADDRRHRAEHRRAGPGEGRRRARAVGARGRRPRLPDVGAGHLRRR